MKIIVALSLLVVCAITFTNAGNHASSANENEKLTEVGTKNATSVRECCIKEPGYQRPGECSPYQTAIACLPCVDKCHKDEDCTTPGEKCCCHSGCGNFCATPYFPGWSP